MDRQICPEGHSLASRGTDLSVHTLHARWILFLARLYAVKLIFHTIYLEKRYNRDRRHFEL